MRYLITFIASCIVSFCLALAYIASLIPPGEGSFGIAKAVPFILVFSTVSIFCLLWFPANAAVATWAYRNRKEKPPYPEPVVILSGVIFILAVVLLEPIVAPQWLHKERFRVELRDQFGQPVAGATITLTLENRLGGGKKRMALESDPQGAFELSCRPGEDFYFMPVKPGYALASTVETGGSYSDAERLHQKDNPSARHLNIVKMWKLQGAEPLTGVNCRFKLRYTNSPICIDLLAGKIVPTGGDLEIIISRAPGNISWQNLVKWSVELRVVDGGLMDSAGTERITYFAPESGYLPKRIIQSSERFANGGYGGFGTGFYIKSRNGSVYTKLGFTFGINLTPEDLIDIECNGLANTNGSRNWEADPNTYKL